MTKDMTLYHYWRSSSSWRVRWALELKGLKPRYVHVDLLSGEVDGPAHLERNPMGFVPVLETAGHKLIESAAIVEWLDEVVPQPPLISGDAYTRAHIRGLMELINAGTQPLQNLSVLDELSTDPARRKQWSQYFIRNGLRAYQTYATPQAGLYSVGDTITAADLFLIPQLYNALRNDIALDEFPLLKRIWDVATATAACEKSHPDRFQP